MSNISTQLQGDVGVGRGQLGIANFITLTQPISQLWVDAGIDRPSKYFITPNGINDTVKLPPIGTGINQAQVGHTILIKNGGVIPLIIQASDGGMVISLPTSTAILLTAETAAVTWELITFTGSGEANTASNVGTGGVGLFKLKTGVDLQFKKLAPGSSKTTITDNIVNSTVDVDVDETFIPINNLSGILGVPKGGTGVATLTSGNVLVGNGVLPVLTTKAAPVGDFVGTTDIQILTNKTITDVSNIVVATDLRTTTGVVNVSGAAAPLVGQVLTATSAIAANWQTPTVVTHYATYSLVTERFDATVVVYTVVANFQWYNARYTAAGYTNGAIVYSVVVPGSKTIDIQLYDVTNATTLGSVTGLAANTIGSFSVINPISDAIIELQIRRSGAAGMNPYILSAELEYQF